MERSAGAVGAAAVATAVVATVAVPVAWLSGGGGFDIAWLPSWGARLAFRLDGLGALYALLATGIGVAVFTYATAYLPRHLEHEERPQADGGRPQPDLTGSARRSGGGWRDNPDPGHVPCLLGAGELLMRRPREHPYTGGRRT